MKSAVILPILLIISFAALLPINTVAQHSNVLISGPQWEGLPTEPAVVMNPLNPSEILAAGMPDNAYYSTDGGFTWIREVLQSAYGVNADPVLVVDQSGRYYYIHLPYVIERIVCHRKDAISSSWNIESFAALDGIHDVDKEWASYDPVNNNIYLSWTYFDEWGSSNPEDSSCIFLSRSADGGVTWSEPSRVSDKKGNAQGGNYSAHGSYNTTGPDGEVYVCWFGPSGLMFDKSTDQGNTWLAQDINTTGQHMTWLYSIPGINLGVTFPFIACDRSGGPNNGNIYISWADKRNGGNDADVFIVKSSDGGMTWSVPIRVNNDPPDRHNFMPALTVDQATGKVWVVFYDRRNYTDTNTDVYMAVSEDGGNSFLNFRVSESPFIPLSNVFFGHYIGITAHDDHVFPVWNRMDDGQNSLLGAIVDPSIVGKEEISFVPEAQMLNYPNPFTESSFISFRLQQPGEVTMLLYDITGTLVDKLIDREIFSAGKHVVRIDAEELNLHPGAYFVKFTSGNEQITTRILFVGQ